MIPKKRWGNFLVIIVVLYIAISGNRGLWNLYKLHQEKNNLSERNALLKLEINRYQLEYTALDKNITTVEKQAREELNLVKPGEIVYKFTKTEGR
jgi:cell division protein FtsB